MSETVAAEAKRGRRPTLAYAMRPDLTPDLLTDDLRQRIRSICDVLADEPLTEFESTRSKEILARTEILFTSWGCPYVESTTLAWTRRLRLIAHAASSVKAVAAPEVWQAGIAVVSAAEAAAPPVAEYALAAILLANKGVFGGRERYRNDQRPLRYPWTAPGERGNFGTTVGVIGASRVGRKLLGLLAAFDLRRLLYDPHVTETEAGSLGASLVSLDELLRCSDIVTLHVPALSETRHMIDRRALRLMRDGATLVNTARGSLVDHGALMEELIPGRLNAILDVTDPEPLPPGSPLFDLPNVFVTPHMAGAAGAETQRMAELILKEIRRFTSCDDLQHRVRLESLSRIG